MRKTLLLLLSLALAVCFVTGCATDPAVDTDPVSDTADPVESVDTPDETDDTTVPPNDTTEAPAVTTEKPTDTTEVPDNTTEAPNDTTEPPADTTEKPSDTTEPPANTTEAPAVTTEAPAVPVEPIEITADHGVDVDSIELPADAAEVRPVSPVHTVPTVDGDLTVAEWGENPDFRLDRDLTMSLRTYCRDYYGGHGNNIPDTDYCWAYDSEYLYLAVRLTDHTPFTTPAEGAEYVSHTRSLAVEMGNASFTVNLGDTASASLSGVTIGYARTEDTQTVEMRIPLSLVGVDPVAGGTFKGFIEDRIAVKYYNSETEKNGSASVYTRTAPMYAYPEQTCDLFVLAPKVFEPDPIPSRADARNFVDPVEPNGAFHLEFGEPIVLEQGLPGDRIWGHYNFPSLTRYLNGMIRVGWAYGRDSIYYEGGDVNPNGKNYTVSIDSGKTWTDALSPIGCSDKNLMPNGKYFTGLFSKAGSRQVDYLDDYTPAYTWGSGYRMFFAEDIGKNDDTTVYGREYDPETGKTTTFEVTVNWPYMPLVQWPKNYVYPVGQMFSLSGGSTITVDGELYTAIYFYGFDSTASSREDAIKDWSKYYSTYILKSSDYGRTWDLLAQLPTDENITGFSTGEGLCEPEMTVTPDGTFVLLMRTGNKNPLYISYSRDKGDTWTIPEKFDDFGVLPQIITLDCGVTLTSYGRPFLRVRATSDPSGIEWEDPIAMGMSALPGTDPFQTSCFYTALLELDGNTALMAYTDFNYPNEDGEPVKTVLVRTITVVPD